MAAIDSDAKTAGPIRPAASTRRPSDPPSGQGLGPEVYVRDASHYATGAEKEA
jgi:hypothetical protein